MTGDVAARGRRLSRQGLALLKELEGRKLDDAGRHVVYRDQAGKPTIGYGHLIKPGEDFSEGLDEAGAEALLRADVAGTERIVHMRAPRDLAQRQFDALVIFAFNIGHKAFETSTALKRLHRGDLAGAAEAMAWWNKITDPATRQKVVSPGLMNRRSAEIALFLGDDKPQRGKS